jgi:hypothetical protein
VAFDTSTADPNLGTGVQMLKIPSTEKGDRWSGSGERALLGEGEIGRLGEGVRERLAILKLSVRRSLGIEVRKRPLNPPPFQPREKVSRNGRLGGEGPEGREKRGPRFRAGSTLCECESCERSIPNGGGSCKECRGNVALYDQVWWDVDRPRSKV